MSYNGTHEAIRGCRSPASRRPCTGLAGGAHDATGHGHREAILRHYGQSELLSRLSDPFWFQALGCVMGMDWHSSGITTSVMGALKRGLHPRSRELGIYVCGGRGRYSRNTPGELRVIGGSYGPRWREALVRTSRLIARVDNNAIPDGFQLYLHTFVLTRGRVDGRAAGNERDEWAGPAVPLAFATVRDFTDEPHTGIVGEHQGVIMNLVDHQARPAQHAMLEVARERPETTLREARRLLLPARHDVRAEDVNLQRLGAVLSVAYERDLRDFASLLLLQKLGPRTLQSLALIAEVIHGTPTRFSDPARFSFAHGGKDGHPFPVPLKTYDESVGVLRSALDQARVGDRDK